MNSSAPESTAPIDAMRGEFRHLMKLLTFATAYNSGGLSALDHLPTGNDEAPKKSRPDDDDPFRHLTLHGVLNALAVIFVRNHEIFAVTCGASKARPVMMSPEAGEGEIPLIQEIICLKNPDRMEKKLANSPAIVNPGRSLDIATDRSENEWWNYVMTET